MQFRIPKKDFANALAKVQGLTGRKTNFAITTTVLLNAQDQNLMLTATDLETGFEGRYEAEVHTPGMMALNGRKLFEIVRDYPDEIIHITEKNNLRVEIGNEKVNFKISGLNTEDFPEIPLIEDVVFFDVDAAVFKTMVERAVAISPAADEKRVHVVSVQMERLVSEREKILRLVSTDVGRLSKMDCSYPPDFDLPEGGAVLIPKKGLTEVAKFLDTDGNARIGIKDNHLIVKKGDETIIIRLLEGTFPKYKDVIVKKEGYSIILDKHLFHMMLKRMSILTSEDYRGVLFKFADERLEIHNLNPDMGESKEDMEIDYNGPPIEISFNPRFIIETLGLIDEDKVLLHLVDEGYPCLIHGIEDPHYVTLIMPMRI